MKLKLLTMSAAISALIAGGALAQDTATDTTEPMTDTTATDDTMVAPAFTSLEEMTVGDMLSMWVYDPAGDKIGDIDYVIAHADGASGVIGIGGFLSLGEYTVAIPLEEFALRDDGISLLLNTDAETLKTIPEIDESGLEGLPADVRLADLLPDDDGMMDNGATDDTMSEDTSMDTDTSSDTDVGTETDTDIGTDTDVETDTDIGADTDVETDADSSTEMETETETTTQ